MSKTLTSLLVFLILWSRPRQECDVNQTKTKQFFPIYITSSKKTPMSKMLSVLVLSSFISEYIFSVVSPTIRMTRGIDSNYSEKGRMVTNTINSKFLPHSPSVIYVSKSSVKSQSKHQTCYSNDFRIQCHCDPEQIWMGWRNTYFGFLLPFLGDHAYKMIFN